jgi:preprotein translocase subunit YajC
MTLLTTLLVLAAATTGDNTAEPAPSWAQENPQILLVFLVGFIVLMYFTLVGKPQRQEAKKRQDMLSTIQRDDRVVTIGGIHGRVAHVDREKAIITVKVSKGVEIDFTQAAISSVTRGEAE